MGTVASLLAGHVSFRCTSVDRIGIRGYVPGLQYEGGVLRFLLERGYHIPSPAGLAHNHDRLVAELDAVAAAHDVPVVRFKRDQCKEDIARPYQDAAAAAGRSGLVLVGKAQERTSSWRGFIDESHAAHRPNHPHFSWRRMSSVPDHWYGYFYDADWGPAFVKICGYAPYPLWACANGHEWAKAQLAKAGIGFEALDNGLRSVEDAEAARRLCARLGSGHVRDLLRRMTAAMPDPLTAEDRRAGFDWRYSVAQLEVSDTAVFDQPARARAWFESAIRDHLDLGRPDRVSLVVDRRIVSGRKAKTPGRFATEVITRDVAPQLQIHYKSSKVKGYLKERRALRVETTINNPGDFGLLKTLNAENWRAMAKVGREVNGRFLAALGEGAPGLPDAATLSSVVLPSLHDGQRAPALRFGDPRATALFASLASFAHVVGGLTNAGLCRQMVELHDPGYTSRQATYDLRRLRLKGLVERVPHTRTYRVTDRGRRIATFFTRLASRVVVPVLTELDAIGRPPRTAPSPLVAAWRAYDAELTKMIRALAKAS